MTDHPEGFTPPDDENQDPDDDPDAPQPIHGQVRHNHLSARVPESVGEGVFSNGVMILTGQFEIVLDFILRMGEQQRVVARCILPKPVGHQLSMALQENIRNYEARYGAVPKVPTPKNVPTPNDDDGEDIEESSGAAESQHPENQPAPPLTPKIEDIYDEFKVTDVTYAGHYANAVLIRHSGTEFCLDFITNFFPRSIVSARVFLAAPHVRPLLNSLIRSLTPPGTSQEMT